MARRRAVVRAWEKRRAARLFLSQSLAHYDRALNAEHEAREALAMRDGMRTQLAALERRAENAEAENAELWAEIEALTAPSIPVHAGAIRVGHGAA
jgi:seryl-tRNA synthetase